MDEMNPTEELTAKTFLSDTIKINTETLLKVFNLSPGSQEIQKRFMETELPTTVVPQLLAIIEDAYKNHHEEPWDSSGNHGPVENNLKNDVVRNMLKEGSASFEDKGMMLEALQRSFRLADRKNWTWADWNKIPVKTLAKEVRDQLGLALPALHDQLETALKRPDLKKLNSLINWDDPLDLGSKSKEIYANTYSLRNPLAGPVDSGMVATLVNTMAGVIDLAKLSVGNTSAEIGLCRSCSCNIVAPMTDKSAPSI